MTNPDISNFDIKIIAAQTAYGAADYDTADELYHSAQEIAPNDSEMGAGNARRIG